MIDVVINKVYSFQKILEQGKIQVDINGNTVNIYDKKDYLLN